MSRFAAILIFRRHFLQLLYKVHRLVTCATLFFSHLFERFGGKRFDTTTFFFQLSPGVFEIVNRFLLLSVCVLGFSRSKFLFSLTLMFRRSL